MTSVLNKTIFAGVTAVLALSLTACASTAYQSDTAARSSATGSGANVSRNDMGQMTTRQTPQGETGTPHTHQ